MVSDQSKSFCLLRQYPWFKAGSVRPSVTRFGKCWAGRAIIQFTGLMYNPFSLSSSSDSQDQPLITFTQPSWFILCIILHTAPEGKSSPFLTHIPLHSCCLPWSLPWEALSSKTGAFLTSQLFSFICPSPWALHEVFPAAQSPSTALFATQILEFPLHPCLHMPLACSSSGRIWVYCSAHI